MPFWDSRRSPLVSVIIATLNSGKTIRQCLESILDSSFDAFEVILVDNGSNDNTIEIAKELGVTTIIQNCQDQGQAGSLNIGARKARGDYLMFVDSDAFLDRTCIADLLKVIESDATIGAVQPLILDYKVNIRGGSSKTPLAYMDTNGEPVNRWVDLSTNGIREIFFCAPIAMMTSRQIFDTVGGFDDSFYAYGFEVDYGWRLWLAGYRCVISFEARATHVGGVTSSKLGIFRAVFHQEKNKMAMLIKNYELTNILLHFPIQMFLQLLRIIAFRPPVIARVKAFLWLFGNIIALFQKGFRGKSEFRKVSDRNLIQRVIFKANFIEYLLRLKKLIRI